MIDIKVANDALYDVHGRIALVLNPKKELFQTPTSPRLTGRLKRSGHSKKCLSMVCAPPRNCFMMAEEYCSDSGSMPTAEHTE
jgi:hypothetical protein